MTALEKKFIQFYRNADDISKDFIFKTTMCFAYCGDAFFAEMKGLFDKGDKDGMRELAAKWFPLALEKEGSQSNGDCMRGGSVAG